MEIRRLHVIGAGAWGTALAALACENGLVTRIWAHEPAVAEAINGTRENPLFLPGVPLPESLAAVSDMAELGPADAALLVAPAQHMRAVTGDLAAHLGANVPVVVCAKGIEAETGRLMTEVLDDTLPAAPRAVLSGPTFAGEVARGRPTAVTVACGDDAVAEALVAALGSQRFRPYAAADVIGAQVGGAVKNVMAIACGVVEGLGLGENARAALITRGLAETTRLAVAKGAEPATLMGLSGLGDLALTCTSGQSRNYSLGVALGHGEAAREVMGRRRSVAEGAFTAGAVAGLAEGLGIEMPICDAVHRILDAGADLHEVIDELLSRPFRREDFGG